MHNPPRLAGLATLLGLSALTGRQMQRVIERAIPPEGRFFQVDGLRLHALSQGSDQGRPLLMIHGLWAQAQIFTMRLSPLLVRDHRMLIVDRPGWGYSDPLPATAWTLAAQADRIARLIRHGNPGQPPLVVAHSLGGAVALQLALRHPGLIAGLALITPVTHPLRGPVATQVLRAALNPVLTDPVAHTIGSPLAGLGWPALMRQIFAPERCPPGFGRAGGGYLALRPAALGATARDLVAALDEMPALSRRYGELALPVHVIAAEQDHLLNPGDHAIRLARERPDTRLTLVPGGHVLPLTQPGLVAAWLRDVSDRVFRS